MTNRPVIAVSVRDLVGFVLRTGDLAGSGEFVGPMRALEGTRGHQRVQRSRPAGYQTEVALTHKVETPAFTLQIKGRIDGVLATNEPVLLEEIKTVRGSWDGQADPLHWAQGKIYAHIYAGQRQLPRVEVQLTYLDLDSGRLTELRETFSREALKAFFDLIVAEYLEWANSYFEWCRARDTSVREVAFPFKRYRPGQRELSVAVYRTIAKGGRLFAEAPTGIGKTISVLFPTVKALAESKTSRVFYLTAKTVGRTVAEKAVEDLRGAGARLRSVTLTAKDKICFNNGQPCDVRTCPFAIGYYDRNKAAIKSALAREHLTRPIIEEIARQHNVCSFELSLDVSLWVDIIICDYNYAFDPKSYLKRHFSEEENDYVFLIDEAHNLPDRAREMFSADLDKREVLAVKKAIHGYLPRCAKALTKINSALIRLGKGEAVTDENDSSEPDLPGVSGGDVVTQKRPGEFRAATQEIPEEIVPLLRDFMQEAERWLALNQAADYREALQELYFRAYSFVRTAESYDERYVTIFENTTERTRLRLFCLDPSHLLGRALERGQAAVFFSATLSPLDYFRDTLSGSAGDKTLQLPSPFPPENLRLLVQDRVATNFKARESTYDQVARDIAAVVRGRAGNYLVYFPSYKYLEQVRERFTRDAPGIETITQSSLMTEREREGFLAQFHAERAATLVGFAIMGGVFGEGIDLVSDRLSGAIVVGVGLPQLCFERDLMRDYFQRKNGAGFEYAYVYPGMNRVLQAMGRVIRSETDRGVVLLIDTRFGEPRYKRLFPAWWQPVKTRAPEHIATEVVQFWNAAKAG